MPSVSEKQRKSMNAAAHDPAFAARAGIKPSVAMEFSAADKAKDKGMPEESPGDMGHDDAMMRKRKIAVLLLKAGK